VEYVAFCGTQQIAGREKIPTLLSDTKSGNHTQRMYVGLANDFAMTAFCVEQNADAWKRINN
jgi:hypothetical protein